MRSWRDAVNSALARSGYILTRTPKLGDVETDFWTAHERVRPYTMASMERNYALWSATRNVVDRGLAGDFVECGVWRGGSSMMAALALLSRGDTTRGLHLFDTFEGMTPPTDRDVSQFGEVAHETWTTTAACVADEEDVRRNMDATGYPAERVKLVAGRVEETIPRSAPERISVLRLDTDWYESTAHELEHLYPRLEPGGVLIVDDYGHWEGARQAVDEYFAERPVLLTRIDYTGRLAVKAA